MCILGCMWICGFVIKILDTEKSLWQQKNCLAFKHNQPIGNAHTYPISFFLLSRLCTLMPPLAPSTEVSNFSNSKNFTLASLSSGYLEFLAAPHSHAPHVKVTSELFHPLHHAPFLSRHFRAFPLQPSACLILFAQPIFNFSKIEFVSLLFLHTLCIWQMALQIFHTTHRLKLSQRLFGRRLN